jgi:hypothetical protein
LDVLKLKADREFAIRKYRQGLGLPPVAAPQSNLTEPKE